METVEVVYTYHKVFSGKDALKEAKKFAKEVPKRNLVKDGIEIYDVDSTGGTKGYWSGPSFKRYIEMDG